MVATGLFQRPRLPPVAAQLPRDVLQLHSSQYRNPEALPPGAILVVGTGQSGAQIAEELHEAGRRVYLAVSRATRMPRRYRGLDQSRWMFAMTNGNFRTVDMLPSPRAKFAANPHLSGKNGGHDINLRRLRREGVVLVGRIIGADGMRLLLADDLEENLRRADEAAAKFKQEVNAFIERTGTAAPPPGPDERDDVGPSVSAMSPASLDVNTHAIRSVIWASGYQFDFSWVHVPWVDEDGYPIQQRGVTAFPGLYVVGLPWLHTVLSGLIFGVGPDAEHIARHMAEHDRTLGPVPLS